MRKTCSCHNIVHIGMNALAELVCALALSVGSDSLSDLAGLSAWKYIPLERKDSSAVWMPLHFNAKDFQDTRFEYRWKSERIVDNYVCTVEIRPRDDIGQSDLLPELNIVYYDPSSLAPGHFRVLTAHDVTVGRAAHLFFKPSDCRRVDFVYWRK
jgi:hypothetical protein